MAHDIFISYSSEDKQTADAICHVLESNKLKCWIAPRNIRSGKSYAEQIMTGIKSAKIVVLVFSQNSQESVFVNNEIDTAFSNNKPIISFKIDETLPKDKMEFFLKSKHWLDAYPEPEKIFETLVKDAAALCEEHESNDIQIDSQYDPNAESSLLDEKFSNNQVIYSNKKFDNSKESSYNEESTNADAVYSEEENTINDIGTVNSADNRSFFSKYKLPIIVAIVALIAIVGIGAFMSSGGNNIGATDYTINLDFIDMDDDRDTDYSWNYSFFIFGTISPAPEGDLIVHSDFYDASGKVIDTDDKNYADVDGDILGLGVSDSDDIVRVSVELRDASGKVLTQAEATNFVDI